MTAIEPTAVFLAILLTVIPFSFLLRLLRQLPQALVLSHKRWSIWLNCVLIAAVTASTALFLNRAYNRTTGFESTAFEFVIAATVYGFGLVLFLRQFCGVYEEFIITVTAGGLVLQKTAYSNIAKADSEEIGGGEVRIRIETAKGQLIRLILPKARAERFYAQTRKKHSGEEER